MIQLFSNFWLKQSDRSYFHVVFVFATSVEVWLFATGLCKVIFSNILQQFYPSDKDTLVMVQDFSSTTWYAENSTLSLRDRRPRMCCPDYGKEMKSEFSHFFFVCVWWGEEKNLPVSCHSGEWAVVVMMLKYTWENEMLRAEPLMEMAVCFRETRFLYVTSVRGFQACELLMRYLTYPRTLPFDQTDLPPTWRRDLQKENGFPLKNFIKQ